MDEKITYRQQVSFCGKPRCRKCRDGIGHGPYWFAYSLTTEGRTVRTYIGKQLPPGIAAPVSFSTSDTNNTAQATAADGDEIETLNRLLAQNPTDETTALRLMIALAKARRRGEALRIYQRYIALLQTHSDRSPSPAIQNLYETIQHGENHPTPGEPGASEHVGMPLVGIRASGIHQSPLVGRDRELVRLRRLLATAHSGTTAGSARSHGSQQSPALVLQRLQPQFVVLMGESGIGKTRLAEETEREATQGGWVVAWSHAYAQESGIPYRLWSELLRNLIAQGIWNLESAGQARLYAPLMALLPELRELWGDVKEREQEQVRLREAVYELLATISAQTPLLIVLDDVQWADGSSCELIGYVARRLSNQPIALLGTCRETELAANATLHSLLGHMQREQVVEYLHVQPLADTEIATLVSHLPGNIVQHIQAQAAGNPFFAEELAQSLHYQEGQPSSISTLPKTITAALNARMQRLSAPCQQLLERAAVLGGSFGVPLIYAMGTTPATPFDEDTMLDLLDEAIRSGILTEEGMGARITYRFWHPLLATHLYTTLSATRRGRMHRRAAEALQSVYGARGHAMDEQAAAIVDHLVKGGASASQTAHFAELAANHAYTLSAYPEAEQRYRQATQALEEATHADHADALHLAFLLERLAECVVVQGNFKEARTLFERVLATRAAHREDTARDEDALEAQVQALLWCEIGWTWRFTGDQERAWQCSKRGEQVLQEVAIPPGFARARLHFQQSSLLWQEGRYEEARHAAMQALEVFETASAIQATKTQQAQPPQQIPQKLSSAIEDAAHLTRIRRTILGDPVDLGRTYALLGALANATGQRTESLEYMSKALAIYERYDRQREIAHVCNNIGHVYMKQALYQQARSSLQRAYRLAERIGDAPLMGVVLHNLGELALSSDQHDPQEAELYFKRSLLMAEQIDDREYLSRWNADIAFALIERGDLAGAAQPTARALSVARAMHNSPCVGLSLVALGTLRLAQARTCLEKRNDAAAHIKLRRARRTLQHALNLRGLEVETSTRGHIILAETLSLLGDHKQALAQAALAMEEAKRYELGQLMKRCEAVIASIKTW
jgi:tetratricopeptide (TPR) repeat protein